MNTFDAMTADCLLPCVRQGMAQDGIMNCLMAAQLAMQYLHLLVGRLTKQL